MNPLTALAIAAFLVLSGVLVSIARSFRRAAVAAERAADAAERVATASQQNFAGALTGVAEALEQAGHAMTGLQVAAQTFCEYDRLRNP